MKFLKQQTKKHTILMYKNLGITKTANFNILKNVNY